MERNRAKDRQESKTKQKACPKYNNHGRLLDSRQEGTSEEEPEETKKRVH